MFGLIN